MLKQKLSGKTLTILFMLLFLGFTSAERIKRQIFFEDENRLFSSECRTPDRKSGYCIRFTSCTTLVRTVSWRGLHWHFCGFEGEEPKVCCPQTRLEATTTRRPTQGTTSTSRTTPTPSTTLRTTPIRRTTVRITSSATVRTTTRRPIELPKESRIDRAATIGTTMKPRVDRKAKPRFLPRVCGKSLSPQQRVVGGTVAEKGSWPWMAVVSVKTRSGILTSDCGGALVTSRHVVTAAHCVVIGRRSTLLDASRIVVRLGAHNLTVPNEPGSLDLDVEDVRPHERFDTRTFKNDIAVLKLRRPVTFTETVAPVCLPYDSLRDEDLTSRAAYVVGFGTTTFNGNGSDVLMQAGFYIQSQEMCKRAYEKDVQITRVYICAGMTDGSKDACQGDSGGPLLAVGRNSSFYLVGVVSFGKQCGVPNYPGVYTRVTEFLDWLSENISD